MTAQPPDTTGLDLLNLEARVRVYDLAQPLEAATPTSPTHPPFRMALYARHGDFVRDDGFSGANELITMSGHAGTHIDAFCHVSHEGLLHGGIDAREAAVGGRFRALGVETIAPIVCRGVLLDAAAAVGKATLEPGHRVTAAELETACQKENVEVREGDAVLVRTGWPVGRFNSPAAFLGFDDGVPGPDDSAARWLAEKKAPVTGADTFAYEWLAPRAGLSRLPVHLILLFEHGIHIIEMMNLEDLARDRVYEFLFVAAPLKLVGATGSPVRPLAVLL